MHAEKQFNEQGVCEGCGRFGAYDFGGPALCAQCYAERGSCCSEFGVQEPEASANEDEAREV